MLGSATSRVDTTDKFTYGGRGEVKSAPFGAIADFRKQQLRLSLVSPSPQSRFIVFRIERVILPRDMTPGVTAHPASIDVHIDIHAYLTMDMDCDI